MKNIFILIIVSCCLSSCNKNSKEDKEFKELFGLMHGSFDSSEQAKIDSTYFNISMHMYPIWKNKGNYLYVEQALSTNQNRPYRQRVYELKRLDKHTFASYIYKIPNDSLWVGKWKTPADFNKLNFSDLNLKEGCEVVLKRKSEEYFIGETGKETCISTMRGASFARSEVEIKKDIIISWDRGFDSKGNYVWGAEKAGYIFKKIK